MRDSTYTRISLFGAFEFESIVYQNTAPSFFLIQHTHTFRRRGIYLLLEKTKTVCYRNLFKRVYLVLEQPNLSLVDVARAFKWQGLPMDLDEIECILANLIFRGYVRGYLSHTKRILVLSKSNPFPTSAVIASAK
jgi:nuclear mRNA export protein PCID2/THP1